MKMIQTTTVARNAKVEDDQWVETYDISMVEMEGGTTRLLIYHIEDDAFISNEIEATDDESETYYKTVEHFQQFHYYEERI